MSSPISGGIVLEKNAITTQNRVSGGILKISNLQEQRVTGAVVYAVTPIPNDKGNTASLIAGENLSALRIVTTNAQGRAIYVNPSDIAIPGSPLFLTLQSALNLASVEVQISGSVNDAGWNWIIGVPIWLGANGTLTQSPPASDALVQVAQPMTATRILFNPQEVILL